MLTPEAAWEAIASRLEPLSAERLAVEAARGRVLAARVVARSEAPASDVSAMDGFALRGVERPGEVEVAGTIAAGDPPGFELGPGRAARIFTGAPVPADADRVVPVEQTRPAGSDRVAVESLPPAGAHIRRRGEILRPGDELLPAGAVLGPAAIALLASQGIAELAVRRRPRVAILATGDEVVPSGSEPGPGQLRDSHTPYLGSLLAARGVELRSWGIAPDRPGELEARLAEMLEAHDVALVCGGVSAGDRDYTEDAFAAVGAVTRFDGVAIQPGKPLVFADLPGRAIFGLPGNPGSVEVTARLFVLPALARLEGRPGAGFWSDARRATLAAPLPAGKARDRFVPGRVEPGAAAGERVRPLGVRGSHDLATFAAADRLLRIRAGEPARDVGDPVELVDWD